MEIKIKQIVGCNDRTLFAIYFESVPVYLYKPDLIVLGDELHEALFGDESK